MQSFADSGVEPYTIILAFKILTKQRKPSLQGAARRGNPYLFSQSITWIATLSLQPSLYRAMAGRPAMTQLKRVHKNKPIKEHKHNENL